MDYLLYPGVPQIYYLLSYSYNHDNMNKTANSRSAEHVPDCSLVVCAWFTLPTGYQLWITSPAHCLHSYDYQHWTTVDYLTVVCFFLMDSLSAMNYQLIINCGLPRCGLLSPDRFTLKWIINCGLPRCGLLSPDGFTLKWIINCGLPRCGLPSPDGFTLKWIINCGLPCCGLLSPDGFCHNNYRPWIILLQCAMMDLHLPCPMDYQLSSVAWSICCSVHGLYLLSATLTMENSQLGSSIRIR